MDGIVLMQITDELSEAKNKFPGFHSLHEGYAVLKEEVDELWDLVRGKEAERDPQLVERECIQIAAMAIRIILDCGMQGYRK